MVAGLDEYDAGAPLPAVECLLAQNRHGTYCVPVESAHRPAAKRVLAGEVWEPATLALMAESAATGDIVTAGTYFGDLLPGAAAAAAPGTTIWAFEPNPTNYACATWTLRLNALANVRLFHAALGPRPATTELVVSDADGRALGGTSHVAGAGAPSVAGGGRRFGRRRTTPRTASCAVAALDTTLDHDRPLQLIQLDVEGFEAEALAGAVEVLERWRPALLLESRVEGTPVWATLQRLGYASQDVIDGNTRYLAADHSG